MNIQQIAFAKDNEKDFPIGFFFWLQDNQHIWKAFEQRALEMAQVRSHYSARTIIEVLRWNSDLADKDVTFKINDHSIPGLSRLWMKKHGEDYPKFFELRSLVQ